MLKPLLFSCAVLASGCCTNDTSFYGRVRQANDASIQRALGARSMVLVPSQHDTMASDRASVVVVGNGTYEGGAARDSAGVLHPIILHPRVRSTESHRICACEEHGGMARATPVDYVPVGTGSAGAPIDLEIDELVDLEIGQSRCGGPPRP